ncbi:MAG: serine/threonine protein kinase [Planctomycetia bacterium]|nr:serine/threonine protein kinase [Planctomycetia bacterium]
MPTATAASLVAALRQHHLLEAGQLPELARLQTRLADPHQLVQELLKRGWLTAYQSKLLLAGRAADLERGQYTVLEPLGEGGNGEVFKARHRSMQRIVALKLLRKEQLGDADAVGRFYREIEVLSQIAHPNIVHAYDAGPVGSSLGLAMEYVAGVDLEQMVQKSGKLPVERAIDYIRQAACGLQHAQERGLIHRDIKPANLLVTQVQGRASRDKKTSGLSTCPFGLVKILDMGLARLQQPLQGSRTGNLTVLGGSGLTLGTPDYMSPEQALDFHSVDTRADIYSLGCTFYFLLTGQPPFPGGSLAQKLMKHQQAEPQSIREFRNDLPPWLPAVLDKMLAKRPPDRFQKPGEIVQALASFETPQPVSAAERDTRAGLSSQEMTALSLPAPNRSRRRRLLALLVVAFLLAGGALLAVGLGTRSAPTTVASHVAPTTPTPVAVVEATLPGTSPAPGGLVTNISALSKRRYDVAVARVRANFRTDRQYKLTALSPGLDGAILLRTANDDKREAAPNALSFSLTAPAVVYVGYDNRGAVLPAWLADGSWQQVQETIACSDGDAAMSPIKVFARRYPAGIVSLGGNLQSPAKGAGSNYVVIIKPQ